MRIVIALLIAVLGFISSSPIHGIWNNLPSNPEKRFYGFYNYLPRDDDDRDKRNTLFYWVPSEDTFNLKDSLI